MHDHAFGHPYGLLWPMFWALFGMAFWLVPTIIDHRARMKKIDTMRSLAEKGVPIPPELTAALAPQPKPERTPERDIRSGLVLIAIGGAIAIMASILVFVMDKPAWPVYGVAALPALIGFVYLGLGLNRSKA